MPVRATNTKLLVDRFNFSGSTMGYTVAVTVGELDVTNLESTGNEKIAGNSGGTLEMQGYYTGKGAGLWEQELHARLGTGTPVYVAACIGTSNVKCPTYIFDESWGEQMTVEAPVENVIMVNGRWGGGKVGMKRGKRIFAAAITATGAKTSQDLGAAGSAGGSAYLFVQSITGTATSATIVVESSATEGGTYAAEGTFTFSALGAYKIALSGTVNRWLRINVTGLGGSSAFTVAVVVVVTGVTQT